jgi:putative hydrolase of the HAD superfamily
MTNPIADSVQAWIAAEGIDRASYTAIMRRWVRPAYAGVADANPVHALERGECTSEEFEQALATELVLVTGGPVASPGLLARMFAESTLDQAMIGLFRRLHASGVPTGMLSNSWGGGYPRELFPELFDAVVISSEVGMRKPEPRIFRHAADLLGLPPEDLVFIDDIERNVEAAEQVGFTGILHSASDDTRDRLADLLAAKLG